MLVKDFPDFIKYNSRAYMTNGRRLSWAEYQIRMERAKASRKVNQMWCLETDRWVTLEGGTLVDDPARQPEKKGEILSPVCQVPVHKVIREEIPVEGKSSYSQIPGMVLREQYFDPEKNTWIYVYEDTENYEDQPKLLPPPKELTRTELKVSNETAPRAILDGLESLPEPEGVDADCTGELSPCDGSGPVNDLSNVLSGTA